MNPGVIILLLNAALLALPLRAGAGEPGSPKVQLSKHLQGLQRVLGTWELTDVDEKGKKVTMQWVFQVGADGKTITGVRSGARSASSLFYYDPKLQKVVCVGILESGHVIRTVYTEEMLQKDMLSAESYITTPDAKEGTSMERVRWFDKDHFSWSRTDIVVDGQKRPASPETIMNRVR